jgi:hypothetical protein
MFINKHMAARTHILFTLLYWNYWETTRFVVLICTKNMDRTEVRTNHLIGMVVIMKIAFLRRLRCVNSTKEGLHFCTYQNHKSCCFSVIPIEQCEEYVRPCRHVFVYKHCLLMHHTTYTWIHQYCRLLIFLFEFSFI